MTRRSFEQPQAPRAGGDAWRFIRIGTILLGVLAIWPILGFWDRMPIERVRSLRTDDYRGLYAFVRQSLAGEALEGELHRTLSENLTEALGGRVSPDEFAETMNVGAAQRGASQLSRLEMAAGRMWLLERGGVGAGEWWPALRAYLEGLENSHFRHGQKALVDVWAAGYRNAGLDAGTAAELGMDYVGHPHGPFLEYFVPRMRELIADRRAAGDDAAARLCERILSTLLRDWVLEDGPAGPRLLAAEELAAYLEPASAPPAGLDADHARKISEELSAWRTSYVEALKARPLTVLSPRSEPALTPAAHQRLLLRAALLSWLSAAGVATAAAAVILFAIRAARRGKAASWRHAWIGAGVTAAALLAGGLVWFYLTPEAVRSDFRSDFSSLRYTWRHPFLAGGLALLISMLAALLRRGGDSGKDGFLARWEAGAWGLFGFLTVMLLVGVWAGERARQTYERELRAACEKPIVAVLGEEGERRLESVRRWTP